MSVLIPDTKVFEYIAAGLNKTAYNRTVDEFYSYSMHVHFENKDIETEVLRLARSWCTMNECTYVSRYGEDEVGKFENLAKRIKNKLVPLCPYQLLKYIQCVSYNIERDTLKLNEQDEADLKLLEEWRVQLAFAIIDRIPHYDKALWSEYDENKIRANGFIKEISTFVL